MPDKIIKKDTVTCIECPKGCVIEVESDALTILSINGHSCDKGEAYACSEIQHPVRTLTSTVVAEGLELKMVPVRTDKPIPKDKLFEAMELIRQIYLTEPVQAGEIIFSDLLGLNVHLIATRSCRQL
jgi:CxxC motif-containing protein